MANGAHYVEKLKQMESSIHTGLYSYRQLVSICIFIDVLNSLVSTFPKISFETYLDELLKTV